MPTQRPSAVPEPIARAEDDLIERLSPDATGLVSALVHDLRNPLTSIKGHAQILLRLAAKQGTQVEQLTDGLSRIEQGAERMQGLLSEFVDLARVHTGRPLDLLPRSSGLLEVLDRALAEATNDHPEARLRIEGPTHPVDGAWDGLRLQRAFRILITQTIEMCGEDVEAVVTIGVDRQAEAPTVLISVAARGRGSNEPDHADDFDSIEEDGAADPSFLLRLELARSIVEQHGGAVELSGPTELKAGFSVRLPLGAAGA